MIYSSENCAGVFVSVGRRDLSDIFNSYLCHIGMIWVRQNVDSALLHEESNLWYALNKSEILVCSYTKPMPLLSFNWLFLQFQCHLFLNVHDLKLQMYSLDVRLNSNQCAKFEQNITTKCQSTRSNRAKINAQGSLVWAIGSGIWSRNDENLNANLWRRFCVAGCFLHLHINTITPIFLAIFLSIFHFFVRFLLNVSLSI